MENYTIFKTVDGGFYGVSPSIMAKGYVPADTTVTATPEESSVFLNREMPSATPEEVAAILKDLKMDPTRIKTLTGVEV